MKDLFLSVYLEEAGLKLTADLRERIDLYYNWTIIRTATYFFLKAGHNEERGRTLLEKVKSNLKL